MKRLLGFLAFLIVPLVLLARNNSQLPLSPIAVPQTDVHAIDFQNFDYPSDCWKSNGDPRFGKVIHVSNGEWKQGTADDEVYFSVEKPEYADLTMDGQTEAVVVSACGFTAGNDWDTEVFVLGMGTGSVKLLAKLSSSDWGEPSWGVVWRVADNGVKAKNGEITVSYYVGGSHARPAWVATATFRWAGNQFVRTGLDRKAFGP